MKTTGIVRRIDDLGRVVIPKEIRRKMRIKNGGLLEIYTDNEGQIIFRKYSPIKDLSQLAMEYAEALYKTCGISIIVADRDIAVACAGVPGKDILEHKISSEIDGLIDTRKPYVWKKGDRKIFVLGKTDKYLAKVVMPMLSESDIIGAVIAVETENLNEPSEIDVKLVQTVAAFLCKQLDINL